MKKIFLVLLITLFAFPLFSQQFDYRKTYDEEQIKKFFSTDTVKKDSVYYITNTLDIDKLILDCSYNRSYRYIYNHWYGYPFYLYNNYYWLLYNWYYNPYYNYWSSYNDWYYISYYRYYNYNSYYKYYNPRPQKPYRRKTISSTVRESDVVKRNTIRYERPRMINDDVNNTRLPKTFKRPTTRKPRSTYTKPERNRNYHRPPTVRNNSRSTTVRTTGSSRNSVGNRSTSGNRSSSSRRR